MTWSRFFDHYEPAHCLVAESGADHTGLVHYIFHRNTVMLGPTCYLQDLFTSEAARGRDIAGRQCQRHRLSQIEPQRFEIAIEQCPLYRYFAPAFLRNSTAAVLRARFKGVMS